MYSSKYNKVFTVSDDIYVLYNTLSGAIDTVNQDVFSSNIDLHDDANEELQRYFVERGYLFACPADEEKELERVYASYQNFKREIRPLVFFLVLTYSCNLSCPYCFQKPVKARKRVLNEQDIEPIFKAIAEIRQLYAETKSKPVVALFGGEPLLKENLEVVTEIYRQVSECGYVNGPIISNGVELDCFIPLFQQYRPSGIQITLDGIRRVHDQRRAFRNGRGTFDRITTNIQSALDIGLKIGVRTNLDNQNIDGLTQLAQLADEKGWIENEQVELSLAPVHDRACATYEQSKVQSIILEKLLHLAELHPVLQNWHLEGWSVLDYFRRLLDEDRCVLPRFDHCEAAIGKNFHLDAYGKIYTCIEACGIEELATGQFRPELEFYDLFEQFKQRNIMNMERCKSCCYALICGGGCGLHSLHKHGSLLVPHCGDVDDVMSQYVRFRFKGRGKATDASL